MKIKWRLSKLPTPDELRELVKDKIVTQDEAREILFDQVDETEADTDALKSEIEFLRKLVEDLSNSRTDTVRVIEKHINNYPDWTWNQPYWTYCNGTTLTTTSSDPVYLSGSLTGDNTTTANLSDIKTF